MEVIILPAGWEHQAAPAATLLESAGSSYLWWGIGAALLVVGLLLLRTRPDLATVLAVVAAFALGVAANGLVDDAYIQFRYAANLAAGHGPVFNPGERIEGASGGLWMVVLAVAGRLSGWDIAALGRLLSLVLAPLAAAACALAVRRLTGPQAGAAAALLWAALPTASMYAATGLETSAFATCLWLVAYTAAGGWAVVGMVGAIALVMLRPEGVVLAVSVLPLWRRLNRDNRAVLVSALLGAVAIAGLRFWYYGLPVPHSALVKGVTGSASASQGLAYLVRALLEWWPLLFALPALWRGRRLAVAALVPVAVWSAMVVVKGGDWMPGGRYLLPLVVVLVAALAQSVAHRPRFIAAVGCAVAWGLLLLAPVEEPSPSPVGRAWRSMARHRVQSRWWEALGTWMRLSLPPGTRLAVGPAGAIPYASQLETFDLYGLCSRVTHTRDGEPGHRHWGLAEAMKEGVDVVYPGLLLPQGAEWPDVMAAARVHVADAPTMEQSHEAVGMLHPAEYQTDILNDVIWRRRSGDPPEGR